MTIQTDAAFAHVVEDVGEVLQVPLSPAQIGLSTSIPANSSVTSNVIITNGFKVFAFGTTCSTAGVISIQRYLDEAGTIPQGTVLTSSLVGTTPMILNCIDGYPFQSLTVKIQNMSMTTIGTLTNTLLLLQAQ